MTKKRIPGAVRNLYRLRARRRAERHDPLLAEEGEALRQVRLAIGRLEDHAKPPFLDALTRYLGVTEVRHVPLAAKGRLILDESSLSIEINDSLDTADRVFTHAHELAHLILEGKRLARCQMIGTALRVDSKALYYRVEHLCDVAAEEILLPETWMAQELGGRLPPLDEMRLIGERTHAGVALVTRRAVSLMGLGRIIDWRPSDRGWVATGTFPSKDRTYVEMLAVKDGDLLEEAVSSPNVATGRLTIEVYGEDENYAAEAVAVTSRSVLSLLRFG